MAQKVSASVAEALKVDLPIEVPDAEHFEGIHKAFSSLLSQNDAFVCGHGNVLLWLQCLASHKHGKAIATPTLTGGHQITLQACSNNVVH